MTNILLLGSQHGNELLGERLYEYMGQERIDILPHVTYLTGNIRARRAGTRYVESDLNRSYTGGDATYEQRRARRILRYIKKEAFNLVIDLHTTTCHQPPCLIVAPSTSGVNQFIQASSIKHIVQMNQTIAAPSLIGSCPQAISIEVNEGELTDTFMGALCDDLSRFKDDASAKTDKQVYVVDDLLRKSELAPEAVEGLRNFQYSKYGFYPILVGENSYKKQTDYLGFKAYKVRPFKV